jgi:rod shape-determining protein MreB and related proteins
VRAHADIAVDLGATNTLVYVRGSGIVLCEPSLVAVDTQTNVVRAVGIDAERLLGRGVGSTTGVRPTRNGVITDFDLTVEMLRRFIRKACRSRWPHPRTAVMSVPSGASIVERRAVEEACLAAGVRHAYLIQEPMAAAIGAGLPVTEAAGSMVVDVGGDTTEVAVISLGEIVAWQSIRAGGEAFDEAIAKHLKRERELVIGQEVAEEVKLQVGSVFPDDEDLRVEVRGCDTRSSLPKTAVLTTEEIRGALERPVARIVDAVKQTLGRTPPQLASDLMDRGMILAGGGSLLRGLAERLRQETQMPAHVAELPLTCVAAGSGAWLEELKDQRVRKPPGRRADARDIATGLQVRATGREMIGVAARSEPGRDEDRPVPQLRPRRRINTAETGRLLDDARRIEFPTALRGYERGAVDRYVQRVNQLIAELEISSSPEAAVKRALAEASDEAGEILRRGHQAAGEVIAGAGAEADDMLQQAAHKAQATLDTAQVNATATREAAQREARELRETIAGEAKALLGTARHEAAELRETTMRQLAQLRDAAVHETRQLRAGAQREADEIRANARRRSDEMLERAESRSQELARRAEAIWREYRRLIEDARTAGEQLIAIGERHGFSRLSEELPLVERHEPPAGVSEPAGHARGGDAGGA